MRLLVQGPHLENPDPSPSALLPSLDCTESTLKTHLQKGACLQAGLPPNRELLDFGLKGSVLKTVIDSRLNQ